LFPILLGCIVDAHFEVKMRQEIENVQDACQQNEKKCRRREREKGT